MIRFLLCSILLVLASPVAAKDKSPSKEEAAIRALFTYCVPPIAGDENPKKIAKDAKLPELPKEGREKLFPKGGRGYLIPEKDGNLVMLVPESNVCRITARQVDPKPLWKFIKIWFGKDTPWKLLEEKEYEGAKQETYIADFAGPVLGIMSIRDVHDPESVQAMLTIVRPDDPKADEKPENRTRLKANR